MRRGTGVLVAAALLPAVLSSADEAPSLDIRATPQVAHPPAAVLAVAELVGGAELEEYYCPELVWDWGDGSRSIRQSDCEPFGPDTALERLFFGRHVYRGSGEFDLRVELVRADRVVASARATVIVQGPVARAGAERSQVRVTLDPAADDPVALGAKATRSSFVAIHHIVGALRPPTVTGASQRLHSVVIGMESSRRRTWPSRRSSSR